MNQNYIKRLKTQKYHFGEFFIIFLVINFIFKTNIIYNNKHNYIYKNIYTNNNYSFFTTYIKYEYFLNYKVFTPLFISKTKTHILIPEIPFYYQRIYNILFK